MTADHIDISARLMCRGKFPAGERTGDRGGVDRGEAGLDDAARAVDAAVAGAFRAEWGRIIATLIGMTGDWDLAEECAQDAFAQAVRSWSRDGIPPRPGAWLTTTARRRAIDVLRRRATETAKLQETVILQRAARPPDPGPSATEQSGLTDDRLRLIFTCCLMLLHDARRPARLDQAGTW